MASLHSPKGTPTSQPEPPLRRLLRGPFVYVLIVVAVGGLGSIGGSFVAASLLGISDMAGKYYFPELGAFLIYFVMVALLMWRPVGLFGRR